MKERKKEETRDNKPIYLYDVKIFELLDVYKSKHTYIYYWMINHISLVIYYRLTITTYLW